MILNIKQCQCFNFRIWKLSHYLTSLLGGLYHRKKVVRAVSEKEKNIIKTVAEALPKMSERDKGYFLGYAEAMASKKEKENEKINKEES